MGFVCRITFFCNFSREVRVKGRNLPIGFSPYLARYGCLILLLLNLINYEFYEAFLSVSSRFNFSLLSEWL